ncbi:Hypothetical predicted protein [Prunus dulcis]|uniref:Uncharacterized protein n=1 Tax=Prunus dulcis TaxID=3755 RepID=A0A5E4GKZ5_PRUDU|nr:Hypothetical predicted protein [Prunus dulcis]
MELQGGIFIVKPRGKDIALYRALNFSANVLEFTRKLLSLPLGEIKEGIFRKVLEGDEEHEEHRELKTLKSSFERQMQGNGRNSQYEQRSTEETGKKG